MACVSRVIATGQPILEEIQESFPSGDCWISARLTPVRDTHGKVTGALGISTDISKRKSAEEALKKSQARLEDAMDQAKMVSWEFDPCRSFFTFSDKFYAMLGTTAEREGGYEMPGGVFVQEFIHPDDAGVFVEMGEAAPRMPHPDDTVQREHRVIRRDGEVRYVIVRARGFLDAEGKPSKGYGSLQDITERKLAEIAVAESEEKFRDIFNSTTDAVNINEIDEDGRPGKFIDVNEASCRMQRCTKEELLKKTPFDIITKNLNPPIEKILEVQRATGTAQFEAEHVIPDGTVIPVEVKTKVFTMGGKKRLLTSVRDITERKKSEQLLKKFNEELEEKVRIRTEELSAALNTKNLLLREVYHRVKNNLQIIVSLLSLQSRTMTDPVTMAAIKESTQRVMAMALAHEKLYSGKDLSRIEFRNYLSSLAKSLGDFWQIRQGKVGLEVTGHDVMLDIDTAIPLGLVVNELLSNALRHAFPGDRTGTIRIDASERPDRIAIVVSDNGIGIPESLDWQNTGSLGLRLARTLVAQLEGTIALDRSNGTTFFISIPTKKE